MAIAAFFWLLKHLQVQKNAQEISTSMIAQDGNASTGHIIVYSIDVPLIS